MTIDANFQYVTLLLKADGVDGSTSIVDSSFYKKTATVSGATQLTDDYSVSAPTSIVFNGTTSYITYTTGSDFAFGTGDYTVETWFRASDVTTIQALFDGRVGVTTTGISLFVESGVIKVYTDSVFLSGGTLSTNTWHHVALTRGSGTTTIWLDGTSVASTSSALTLSDGGCRIARHNSSTYYFAGHVDLFRVTKGVCRYTSTFSPSSLGYDPAETVFNAPTAAALAYGGGFSLLASPSIIVYGGDRIFATVDALAPSPVVFVGSGASAFTTAPSPTLSSTVHSSYGDNALIAAAPTATLSCYGGANAALTAPFATLSCTATGTAFADADITAPSPTVASEGTVSAAAQIAAAMPMATLIGYSGAVCSVTAPGAPTVTLAGTSGSVASAAVTLPMFDVVSGATAQNHGALVVTVPMPAMKIGLQVYALAPMAVLVAAGSAVVTATYEAYALNLKHTRPPQPGEQQVDEMTHYTNFPFTHIIRHQNSYYGVNGTGLYLLEGTTDNGAAISYEARTHITDFNETRHKTLVSAYIGGRLGASSTVTLYVGDGTPKPYSFTTPRGAAAQNYRQRFGLGIKHRYFALGIAGSKELSVDTFDFDTATMTRRI